MAKAVRRSYLYGITETKYVKPSAELSARRKRSPLSTYKFRPHDITEGSPDVDLTQLPIQYFISPDDLLFLAARVVDKIPLPSVFEWTNVEVCKWLRDYGYPLYQRSFRENRICGKNLLLVDASALSAMNISNFEHIKHIAYGIRCLFNYELMNFARSISLPPYNYIDIYKIFRIKSGRKFDVMLRTELYQKMQIMRPYRKKYTHWQILENLCHLVPDREIDELLGGYRRGNLYKCKKAPVQKPPILGICPCMPPCECHWNEISTRTPWRLPCLPADPKWTITSPKCKTCMPPCTCQGFMGDIKDTNTLKCLQLLFPERYALF